MSTQTEIILNRICNSAAERRASEIYLIGAQVPFVRVDSKMQPLAGENILPVSFIRDILTSLLSADEQAEFKEKKQLVVVKEISKLGAVQINAHYQKSAPAIRLRLLSQATIDLEKLALPKMVTDFTNLLRGLVFITGPRDSGRSNLAASLLNHINKNQVKFIATLERPIKYNLAGIKSVIEQREVGKDVPSFLAGLRYIRRRNVDVVMVSEISDAQCLRELFAIAEAGSLVFVVIDAESSRKTIERILKFFPADEEADIRYFLSRNLAGIVSTRLVQAIGGGRIRALEVLPGTPAVQTIIAEKKLHQIANILQASEGGKSISLDRYLADMVTSGKVLLEEALKHCIDKEMLQSLIRR